MAQYLILEMKDTPQLRDLPLCLVFSFGDRWYLLELKTEAQSHVCAQIEEIEKKNPEKK